MTSDNDSSSDTDQVLDWSLRLRVDVPDPVPDYFDRPAIIERLMSANYPIAVLKAPGGYGKTTLLSAYCHKLGERGISTAWLRLDAAHTRLIIETYLTRALHHAGIDVPKPDSAAWLESDNRIDLLLGAVAAHAEPCILAVDNLERLTDPGSAEAFNTLLRDAPPNFYVTMACRELPFSLDITKPLLAGRVVMLTASELRFSPEETSAFMGRHLNRQELTAIDQKFEGWPIALALDRNAGHGDTSGQIDSFDLLGKWIESRLWERLTTDQRDFLLDTGLLDRLDPVLLDEVLDSNDSRYRLQALQEFDGLIQPSTAGGPGTTVLHPLLRRHCRERRIRETPARFHAIHHRAALAFERRGDTLSSIRHATEADDPELLGRLIEEAGGIRLWAQESQAPVEEAISFLSHDVVKRYPRLALAQCYMLIFTDRIPEACRLYELAAAGSDNFTRNPTGDVRDLRIDQYIVDQAFFLIGYTPINAAEFQSAVAGASTISRDDDLEPTVRAVVNFGLCIYENRRARFDAAFECAEQIRPLISDVHLPFLAVLIDIQLGSMAMAQGQVQEAETCYVSALQTAHAHYPVDSTSVVIGNALLRELQFERNRLSLAMAAGMGLRDSLTRPGHTFVTHASECVIVTEIAQYTSGVDAALALLTEMTTYARHTKRQTLIRYLSALRVVTLARAGRVAEAERTWRIEALPSNDEDCMDMQALDWREMEMIACARLRLYAACEAFEAGRAFAEQLLRVAETHKLVRTTMRVHALLMALEWHAGDMDAACAQLETFLHYYASADYARPIMREGDVSREVLEHMLDSQPDGPFQSAAAGLLKMVADGKDKVTVARFSKRELAVLKLLPDLRDKQIGKELSLSREGVRYHLRRIFAKLGAHNRSEAVQRARSIGLLLQ